MAEGEVGAVAPVENAPAANAVPAPVAPVEQENAEGQKPEEPVQPKTFTEEEMRKTVNDRLNKERRRLERAVRAEVENDYLRKQLEARDRPTPQQSEDPEPKEADFEGKPYRDFLKAQARWEIRQELKTQREQQTRESQQRQQVQTQQQTAQYVQEKLISKGQQQFSDFDDVVLADHVPISPAMVAAAARLDNGADALYRLCKNESELTRISRLSDVEQAWELRDFAKQLTSSKPTNVPEPIKPTGGKTSVEIDPDKLSVDEWRKWREGTLKKRR